MNKPAAVAATNDVASTLQAIGQLGIAALLIAAVILGFYLLIKTWPVLTQVVTIGNALLELPALTPQMKTVAEEIPGLKSDLAAVHSQLEKVVHEVFPNSGSSMRDKIDQTHTELVDYRARSETRLEVFDKEVRSLRGSVASLHAKLKPMQDATIIEDTLTPAQLAVLRVDPHNLPSTTEGD